jgi:hypothetical protein
MKLWTLDADYQNFVAALQWRRIFYEKLLPNRRELFREEMPP